MDWDYGVHVRLPLRRLDGVYSKEGGVRGHGGKIAWQTCESKRKFQCIVMLAESTARYTRRGGQRNTSHRRDRREKGSQEVVADVLGSRTLASRSQHWPWSDYATWAPTGDDIVDCLGCQE